MNKIYCAIKINKNKIILKFIGTQILSFVLGVAGAAILLDFSTINSSIQPLLKNTLTRMIMRSEDPTQSVVLKMIQENVSRIDYLIIII